MSPSSHLRSRFHEMCYLVSEETALRVRDFVQMYLDIDEHCVGRPNYSCPVHTLYLDSDHFTLYWRAVNDGEHCHQLRVRYLDLGPDTPAYLELKCRTTDGVIKERYAVQQASVPLVLAGETLGVQHFVERRANELGVLMHYVELVLSLQTRPQLHVGFKRECYVSYDGTERVTMDRQIRCEPHLVPELVVEFQDPCRLFQSRVLLELSYRERFPNWFRDLVEHFSLEQREVDKFVTAVSALRSGHRQLIRPDG